MSSLAVVRSAGTQARRVGSRDRDKLTHAQHTGATQEPSCQASFQWRRIRIAFFMRWKNIRTSWWSNSQLSQCRTPCLEHGGLAGHGMSLCLAGTAEGPSKLSTLFTPRPPEDSRGSFNQIFQTLCLSRCLVFWCVN